MAASKVKSKVKSKSVIKPKSNLVKNGLIATGALALLGSGLLVNNKLKFTKSKSKENETKSKVESEKELLSGYKKIIDMLTKKIQDQEANHKKQFEMLNNKLQDQEANIKKLQADNLDRINILTKTIEMLGEVNKKNDKKYDDLNEELNDLKTLTKKMRGWLKTIASNTNTVIFEL